MIKDAEFKVGDKVHFKPYEKSCLCEVMAVTRGDGGNGKSLFGHDDDRIFYRLRGEAVTNTTGKSITESKLYEPAVLEWDVPLTLLHRMPIDRRVISTDNYKWALANISMTATEIRILHDAFDDQKYRYRVRDFYV